MLKDHSDSERGILRSPLHGLLFPISKGYFYMHHSTDRIAHTKVFFNISRGVLAGTRYMTWKVLTQILTCQDANLVHNGLEFDVLVTVSMRLYCLFLP